MEGSQQTEKWQTAQKKEDAELNRAVMDAEQIFIDKNLDQTSLWHAWAAYFETGRASFRLAGNVLLWPRGFDVFNKLHCVHKVLSLITRGDEHMGSCGSQSNLHSLICVMIKAFGTPKYPHGQSSAVDGQLVFLDQVQ